MQVLSLAGASSIGFVIKSKASGAEIKKEFNERKASDRSRNGHRDGYSGDFQTVRSVNLNHLTKVFPDYDSVFEFALEHAEKWEYVVAVYFKDENDQIKTLVAGWGAE